MTSAELWQMAANNSYLIFAVLGAWSLMGGFPFADSEPDSESTTTLARVIEIIP